MRGLRQWWPLVALGLTLTSQVGVALQPQVLARCEEACEDGDESGHCPPACDCACRCHTPKQPAQAQAALERRVVVVERCEPVRAKSPVSPDPKPIRHVPKRAA